MAGKIRGKSHEAYYARYKTSKVWERNRKRKLQRALKKNPGNSEQINKALGDINYRRKTPTVRYWSSTRRRIAYLFKLFTGSVPKVALEHKGVADENYLQKLNAQKPGFLNPEKNKQQGSMFALGARYTLSTRAFV